MKTKTIRLQPSVWKLDVIVTKSEKKAIKHQVKKYGLKKPILEEEKQHLNTVTTVYYKKKGKPTARVLMILESLEPGLVVHELTHVLWQYSKRAGVEVNFESQEWQALMMESLFNQVIDEKGYKKV